MTSGNHVSGTHDRRSVCIHCSGHPKSSTRKLDCVDRTKTGGYGHSTRQMSILNAARRGVHRIVTPCEPRNRNLSSSSEPGSPA